LHLGGDVDFIELLDNDPRGHARARCVVAPEIERTVACGGFSAEFYLLNNSYAKKGHGDERDINRILFHNATHDREDFWQRKLSREEAFTEAEDIAFMNHAIGSDGHGGLVPILHQHFSVMQRIVLELSESRKVEGRRVRELLRPGIPR